MDEAVVVALVETDGRLVEDVEHAHETGADLSRQPDALGLAARQRGAGPGQGEVVEAHVHQEPQALHDLAHHAASDELLALVELEALEELQGVAAARRGARA